MAKCQVKQNILLLLFVILIFHCITVAHIIISHTCWHVSGAYTEHDATRERPPWDGFGARDLCVAAMLGMLMISSVGSAEDDPGMVPSGAVCSSGHMCQGNPSVYRNDSRSLWCIETSFSGQRTELSIGPLVQLPMTLVRVSAGYLHTPNSILLTEIPPPIAPGHFIRSLVNRMAEF